MPSHSDTTVSVGGIVATGLGLSHVATIVTKVQGMWRWLLAILLGALAALSMAPVSSILALVLSLSGLVWLMDGAAAQRGVPWRSAAALGWCYGFGYFLAGLYWIGYAFLVDADFFAWMIPFVIVLLPAGLAIFTLLATVVAGRFWMPGARRLAALTITLALAEWLRGHILTGFPWNVMGYAWAGSLELSQTVSLIGTYGLTVVTLWMCVSPSAYATPSMQGRQSWRWPLLSVLIVICMWGFGAWRLNALPTTYVENAQLRLVQPSIPQAEKWAPGNGQRILDLYLDLTASSGFDSITHVIWPEAAVPYRLTSRPDVVRAITDVIGTERVLLTGSVRAGYTPDAPQELRFYNALHVIQRTDLVSQEAIQATYDKYHLVPFGEYLPAAWLLESFGLKKMVYGESSGYSEGPGLRTLAVPGLPPVSPMICYEIIFPGRTLADNTAAWILNVTNDGWFGDTSGPRQHLMMTRFRAIETGRPVIRSANNGISAVIDPLGRIVVSLPLNATDHVDSPLPEALADTPFVALNGWIFWGILSLIFAIGLAGEGRHVR